MATNYLYPFNTGEDLKKIVSQIDIKFDVDNIKNSMDLARKDVQAYISLAVWEMAMTYYNSGNFESDPVTDTDKDEIFRLMRAAHGNFTLLHHFPWLSIQIGNEGITTIKGTDKTTAFKYQTDAAKEKLRQSAWSSIGDLVDYMTTKKTTEWVASDQSKELAVLLFSGFRDFNKYFNIENDAAYYIRIRHIIQDMQDMYLSSRLAITEDTDAVQLKLCKKAIAYYSMGEAVMQFDLSVMPEPVRISLSNEMQKPRADAILIKEKLAGLYRRTADAFIQQLDHKIAYAKAETDEEKVEIFNDYKQIFDGDEPSVTMF